jgi:hypothetical protein
MGEGTLQQLRLGEGISQGFLYGRKIFGKVIGDRRLDIWFSEEFPKNLHNFNISPDIP